MYQSRHSRRRCPRGAPVVTFRLFRVNPVSAVIARSTSRDEAIAKMSIRCRGPKIDIENDNTLKTSLPWREGIKGRGNQVGDAS